MAGFGQVRGPGRQLPVCRDCDRIRSLGFGPALDKDVEELWLDMLAGSLLGVSDQWTAVRTDARISSRGVLHGLVRYLMKLADPDMRPILAHERKSYAPTTETRQPLHWLPLNVRRASVYRKHYGQLRHIPQGPDHPPTGHHVPLDQEVVRWSQWIWHTARTDNVDLDTAAQRVTTNQYEMLVRPGPGLLAAALAYARDHPG